MFIVENTEKQKEENTKVCLLIIFLNILVYMLLFSMSINTLNNRIIV